MFTRMKHRAVHLAIREGKTMSRLTDSSHAVPVQTAIWGLQKKVNASSLDQTIQELVKLRASQLNGCAFCLSMHVRDALKQGERLDRIAVVSAWRETTWFSDREQAALAWTEVLTTRPADHEAVESTYGLVREVYSETEIADLTLAIIAINSWNRMNAAFGTHPETIDLAIGG